ncbi:MAG: TIGR02587 family membrane protein [Chloroflexi bacterium]|nr:TIGR02587 family membrane protein [Chloroflexota bacterium]
MMFEPRGAPSRPRPGREWSDEFDDAVRGLASGFLGGIPVVFTVDSWWLGDQDDPLESLILLGFSYVLTLAAVYWIGFHRGPRRRWQYFADALEALALAVLALVAVFWSLGQIGDGQAPSIAVGRIAVTVAPVSLGVAVANHLLARDTSRFDPDEGDATAMRAGVTEKSWRRTLVELAASVAGAFFMCLAIVPVDDLAAITTEVPFRNLPFVILLSVIVTYSVVFAAGFTGEAERHAAPGPLQTPFAETVFAYVAALLVCLAVLWLFGRVDEDSAPLEIYAKTVLLAFPASMAAAAGRLAV